MLAQPCCPVNVKCAGAPCGGQVPLQEPQGQLLSHKDKSTLVARAGGGKPVCLRAAVQVHGAAQAELQVKLVCFGQVQQGGLCAVGSSATWVATVGLLTPIAHVCRMQVHEQVALQLHAGAGAAGMA